MNSENNLTKAEDKIIQAHYYLMDFLGKFDNAKRGGIHDFLELALFNMISSSVSSIDKYLKTGHKEVKANEVMAIAADSFQKVLDGIKRNLETIEPVDMK